MNDEEIEILVAFVDLIRKGERPNHSFYRNNLL